MTLADDLHTEYSRYDDAVSCVALLHEVFTKLPGIKETVNTFCWYPKLNSGRGKTVTPDFAVTFKKIPSIVGEVKSGFGKEADRFDRNARQFLPYFTARTFTCADDDGKSRRLRDPHVMLIVPDQLADEITDRLHRRFSDEAHPWKPPRMPAVFAYQLSTVTGEVRWSLKRSAQAENGVLGHPLVDEFTVARRQPIRLPPERFADTKARYKFINDDSPILYSAVIVAHHVLMPMLGDRDVWEFDAQEWRRWMRDEAGLRLPKTHLRRLLLLFAHLGFVSKQEADPPTFRFDIENLQAMRARREVDMPKWLAGKMERLPKRTRSDWYSQEQLDLD